MKPTKINQNSIVCPIGQTGQTIEFSGVSTGLRISPVEICIQPDTRPQWGGSCILRVVTRNMTHSKWHSFLRWTRKIGIPLIARKEISRVVNEISQTFIREDLRVDENCEWWEYYQNSRVHGFEVVLPIPKLVGYGVPNIFTPYIFIGAYFRRRLKSKFRGKIPHQHVPANRAYPIDAGLSPVPYLESETEYIFDERKPDPEWFGVGNFLRLVR